MSENNVSDTTRVFADSDGFFDQLTADVQDARHSVRIQCMSFEADRIGTKLIELLGSKPTLERTLLIDHYSRFVVNDTFLNAPQGWMDRNNARSERRELNILLTRAREMGIRVKFTSPMGFLMHRYPARNHKKMVLIDDDISYLGGMNFTEHNFRWTDLMFRHTDSALNQALSRSFQADLNERDTEAVVQVDNSSTLYILNGLQTKTAFRKLLNRIKTSKKVIAISPYISYPVLDAIAAIPDNRVILPAKNNKPLINLVHRLKRYSGINFEYAHGEMVHAKLLILDDSVVIYGSGNFDTVSYLFEKEVILMKKEQALTDQLNTIIADIINQ